MTPSMDTLLAGVTVLDLTQAIAGPYCTKLLADYGAEVIKIERPGKGDVARALGPFPGDLPHPERSGVFLMLNTGKRSVTLNLKSEAGRQSLQALIEQADILVESFRPGVMERLGLGWENVRTLNPAIVMTSVSNFGQWGPYRDNEMTELIAYAASGSMHCTGVPDREPLKLGGTATLFQAGNLAAAATMMTCYGSAATGGGQHIDYSIMEGQAGTVDRNGACLAAVAYSGEPTFRRVFGRRFNVLPFGAYPCADGYAHFTGSQQAWWPLFCKAIGRPDLATDGRYLGQNFNNLGRAEEVDELFFPWILSRQKREIMELCHEFAGSPVNTMEDLFQDRHVRARGFFVPLDHPEAGRLEYPGAPFNPAEAPHRLRRAPLLGEHTEQVLMGRLGLARPEVVALAQAGVI